MVVELVLANTIVEPSGAARAAAAHGDDAVGAGPVVDDHLLTERCRKLSGDDPRHGVVAAAGRIRHNHGDGSARKVLGCHRTPGERDQDPVSARRGPRITPPSD